MSRVVMMRTARATARERGGRARRATGAEGEVGKAEPIGRVRAMVRALTVLAAMVEAGVGLALTLAMALAGGGRRRGPEVEAGEGSRE